MHCYPLNDFINIFLYLNEEEYPKLFRKLYKYIYKKDIENCYHKYFTFLQMINLNYIKGEYKSYDLDKYYNYSIFHSALLFYESGITDDFNIILDVLYKDDKELFTIHIQYLKDLNNNNVDKVPKLAYTILHENINIDKYNKDYNIEQKLYNIYLKYT